MIRCITMTSRMGGASGSCRSPWVHLVIKHVMSEGLGLGVHGFGLFADGPRTDELKRMRLSNEFFEWLQTGVFQGMNYSEELFELEQTEEFKWLSSDWWYVWLSSDGWFVRTSSGCIWYMFHAYVDTFWYVCNNALALFRYCVARVIQEWHVWYVVIACWYSFDIALTLFVRVVHIWYLP